jgi:hypothetical protein
VLGLDEFNETYATQQTGPAEYLLMPQLDLQPLLEARLWVARLGESDVHKWWRTDGILGSDGAFVGPRVLPRTHPTARARIAFAVAAHAFRLDFLITHLKL